MASNVGAIEIREVITDKDFLTAADLFKEYAAQTGVDLEFQKFKSEIENIKLQYSRPDGILFIVFDKEETPLGCCGVRRFDDTVCELKRMYLRIQARGKGFGELMLLNSVNAAKELGYRKIRLDTLPNMTSAMNLYKKNGFYEIKPYRYNPVEGTVFMEKMLSV